MLPITAACRICTLDGWGQQIVVPIQKAAKDTPSNLLECSICFEIVHSECLLKDVYTKFYNIMINYHYSNQTLNIFSLHLLLMVFTTKISRIAGNVQSVVWKEKIKKAR